jgi:hypothetical protein
MVICPESIVNVSPALYLWVRAIEVVASGMNELTRGGRGQGRGEWIERKGTQIEIQAVSIYQP